MASQTLLAQQMHSILREAASAELGIVVEILVPNNNISQPSMRAKQVLYRFKKDDSNFSHLQIKFSPDNPDTELWLINGRYVANENEDE